MPSPARVADKPFFTVEHNHKRSSGVAVTAHHSVLSRLSRNSLYSGMEIKERLISPQPAYPVRRDTGQGEDCVKAVPFRTRLQPGSLPPFLSQDTDCSALSSSFREQDSQRTRNRLAAGIGAHQLSRLWFTRRQKSFILIFI